MTHTVQAFDLLRTDTDAFTAWTGFHAFAGAITGAVAVTVPPGARVEAPISVDPDELARPHSTGTDTDRGVRAAAGRRRHAGQAKPDRRAGPAALDPRSRVGRGGAHPGPGLIIVAPDDKNGAAHAELLEVTLRSKR